MMAHTDSWRRCSPRVNVATMCWEIVHGKEASTIAVDLSAAGIRIERPYVGGGTMKATQLEIEIPEIDELMWCKGDATFDVLVQNNLPNGGPLQLTRRTGYRFTAAATRDMKRLEEYVREADRARRKRWYTEARTLVARSTTLEL